MKDTIIKSITAILCVIALCITSSVAVNNYSEAVKEAAKLAGTASSTGGEVVNSVEPDADPTDAPAVDSEETTAPSEDTSDVSEDESTTAPANNDDPTKSPASTDMSKAAFVTFFNAETAKIAKSGSYNFNRKCEYTNPIDVGSATKALNKLISSIDENSNLDTVVGGFLGIGEKKGTYPKNKDDFAENYRIKATALKEADLGSFTAKNGVYTFTLANAANPKKTNATPLARFTNDFITHEEIVQGIADFTSAIKVNSTTINYKNIKVTVTVANNKIADIKYSYDFDAKLTLRLLVDINGQGAAKTNAAFTGINY